MRLHKKGRRGIDGLVTLSLQTISECCLDKSISLGMLSGLLGKDVQTVARWCERGFVPGAFRQRGGQVRQGKWRIKFPKRSKADKALARFAHHRPDGWTEDQASRYSALDRLLNRIAQNTKGFRRRASTSGAENGANAADIVAVHPRKMLAEVADLSEQRAMTGEPEGALYHDALVNLYFNGKPAAPGDAYVYAPRQRTKPPRISRDLLKLARAKAMHNHNEEARRALTLPGLCRTLGLPMSWVRRDADLRKLLAKQIYEANKSAGIGLSSDVHTAQQERQDDERTPQAARSFSEPAKKMHRRAALALREWLAGMTPEERLRVPESVLSHYGVKA